VTGTRAVLKALDPEPTAEFAARTFPQRSAAGRLGLCVIASQPRHPCSTPRDRVERPRSAQPSGASSPDCPLVTTHDLRTALRSKAPGTGWVVKFGEEQQRRAGVRGRPRCSHIELADHLCARKTPASSWCEVRSNIQISKKSMQSILPHNPRIRFFPPKPPKRCLRPIGGKMRTETGAGCAGGLAHPPPAFVYR